MSCILLKIEEFQFPNFHRAWHRRTAVAELFRIFKSDSYGDFQPSKQCKYKEKYLFTRENKPLFWQKWSPDVFSYQITRVWNTAQTWGLDRVLIYLSSIACKFLDFIHWMVFDFYFDGVTGKTGNMSLFESLLNMRLLLFFYFAARGNYHAAITNHILIAADYDWISNNNNILIELYLSKWIYCLFSQVVPIGAPYFVAEFDNGERLLHRVSHKMPLQFGR